MRKRPAQRPDEAVRINRDSVRLMPYKADAPVNAFGPVVGPDPEHSRPAGRFYSEAFRDALAECGITAPEAIRRAEFLRGVFLAEAGNLAGRAAAEREAVAQMKAGLRAAKQGDGELLVWLRGLNSIAFFHLAEYVEGDGIAVLDDLRAGSPDGPNPAHVAALRGAIPGAERVRVPRGRPAKDALRNLAWGLANLWRRARGEWPGRHFDVYQDVLAGPFHALLRTAMEGSGHAASLEPLIREIAKYREKRTRGRPGKSREVSGS